MCQEIKFAGEPQDRRKVYFLMIIVKLSLWESRNAANGLQICELELRVCPYAFVFVLIHPSEFYELAISLHFRPHSRGAVGSGAFKESLHKRAGRHANPIAGPRYAIIAPHMHCSWRSS